MGTGDPRFQNFMTPGLLELRKQQFARVVTLSIMVAAKYLAFTSVLLQVAWGPLAGAQSNGDLRLVHVFGNEINWPWGRLEIYLDGEWGTFCVTGFNSYTGDAACRQLGYDGSSSISKARDYSNDIPLAGNSTPIHSGGMDYNQCISCNDVMHILRCFPEGFDHRVDPSCTHDNDVIIDCSPFSLDLGGYDTQLLLNSDALNSTYRSSGVLEIYSSSQGGAFWGWSNICGTNFDQNAANSACRQLGYTGALSYSTSASRSCDNDIWLDGVTCGDYAWSCLDSCFCYPHSLTAVECDPGNVVALTCTFDLNEAIDNTAGSRSECEEMQKRFCSPDPLDALRKSPTKLIIISAVLSTVIVILCLLVLALLLGLWHRRGRAHYQTII